jgi:hypothetical protein
MHIIDTRFNTTSKVPFLPHCLLQLVAVDHLNAHANRECQVAEVRHLDMSKGGDTSTNT